MHRYRHFDDVIDAHNPNAAAILPEVDVDEPFQVQFSSAQLDNYGSNLQRFKYFFAQRTRLERFLIYLTVCLLVVLIAITLVSLFHSQAKSAEPLPLCVTPTCVEVSYTLAASMNQSADPCDDFHQFVCGNWIRKNIIPKGSSSWSTLKELAQKNIIVLKNILEQSTIASLNFAEQEAVKFYRSCMNTDEIERLNKDPLESFFKQSLNMTVREWIQLDAGQTWQGLFVRLVGIFSSLDNPPTTVLPIQIGPDEKNSTWNNIHIGQPALGLGSRDYYVNSSTDAQLNVRNQKIRETYRNVGVDLLQFLGFEKTDAFNRMQNILQFESELAAVSLPMEILQKPNETYHLMSVKQLQDLFRPIGWDVNAFLNTLLTVNASNPIVLNENDQVITLSHDLITNVSQILSNYLLTANKSRVVIDYMLYSFVDRMSAYLPLAVEELLLPLRKEQQGLDSIPERWESCVKRTDATFGYALGSLFINAAFSETDRSKANELIKNIRDVFDENLSKLQWIDEPSRTEAKKKLAKIYQKIGYPDLIKNQSKLTERYGGYPMADTEFFSNRVKILSRDSRRGFAQFRQPVDRTEWEMTPRTVNAYYSPPANEIVFPAGILQPPLFHKDLPVAVNYGGIGSIIGHEITHGFDNQGRQFDADGLMRSWWTQFATDNFEQKSKCFVEQYGKFSLDGQNENGQRTLGENIADNGGVKIAYQAYQKLKQHLSGADHNLRLPGLDYPNDQLFFIAFSHNWCELETTNAMHFGLSNDPHSPARFRVIGTLQNSDAFAEAFNCKTKSTMHPSNKCQLW